MSHVNDRMNSISSWCRFNKLAINALKSEFMILTNKSVPRDLQLNFDDGSISCKTHVKYLGLLLDNKLNYQLHISSLKTKLSRLCGLARRVNIYFNLQTAKKFYYAFVYSTITYCISVWGGKILLTSSSTQLEKWHEKIVKILFIRYTYSGECIFKKFQILKLRDIYKFQVSVYMFKILEYNDCPTLISDLSLEYPNHNYQTRTRNNLINVIPRVNTVRRNFTFQFTDVWNELPEHLKNHSSVNSFKKRLFLHFINAY